MQTVTRLLPIYLLLICSFVARAQTISPECVPAQEQLKSAESAAAQNDWAGAAMRYQDAVQTAPECVEAIVNLGVTFNRLNQPDEAIKTFQKALAKNPQLFAAHLNLGVTYFRAARFDLAKESLRNALKINPEHLQARQLLALSLIAGEDFKEAATELEK